MVLFYLFFLTFYILFLLVLSYHKSHNSKDKTGNAHRSGEQSSFVAVVKHFEIFSSAVRKS